MVMNESSGKISDYVVSILVIKYNDQPVRSVFNRKRWDIGMPKKVAILYPNAKDKDEYYQIEGKLTENAALLALVAPDTSFDKDVAIHITAKAIFDRFLTFANEHNKTENMYMTQDEISREFSNHAELNAAIKYLLDKGFVKEGFLEIP